MIMITVMIILLSMHRVYGGMTFKASYCIKVLQLTYLKSLLFSRSTKFQLYPTIFPSIQYDNTTSDFLVAKLSKVSSYVIFS